MANKQPGVSGAGATLALRGCILSIVIWMSTVDMEFVSPLKTDFSNRTLNIDALSEYKRDTFTHSLNSTECVFVGLTVA